MKDNTKKILKKLNRLNTISVNEWPMDCDETIIAVLTNKTLNFKDRLLAVDLASEPTAIDKRIIYILKDIFINKEEAFQLRLSALMGMEFPFREVQKIGYRYELFILDEPNEPALQLKDLTEIIACIKSIYEDNNEPSELRASALHMLSIITNSRQKDAVLAAFNNNELTWKRNALLAMQYFDKNEFKDEILASLQNPELYDPALEALETLQIPEAIPLVEKIAKNESLPKPIIKAAINTLTAFLPQTKTILKSLKYKDASLNDHITMTICLNSLSFLDMPFEEKE